MTTLTKYPLINDENIDSLESIYPKLCALKSRLEKVVHPDLIKDIEKMQDIMKEVFEATWDSEERKIDENLDKLSEISDKYKLFTSWSISEISAEDLDKPFSEKPIKTISYEKGGTHKFKGEGQICTGLGIWLIADKLIKKSEDDHHIFIEEIKETEPGHYEIYTGS